MSLYTAISTRLGSTMMRRISEGELRYKSDRIRVLVMTDLPEPVVPAIKRWRMSARSAITG